MKDLIKGVMPGSGHSVMYKSPNKGQKTVRISDKLLTKLWKESKNINNKGILMIDIPSADGKTYTLKCYLTKN